MPVILSVVLPEMGPCEGATDKIVAGRGRCCVFFLARRDAGSLAAETDSGTSPPPCALAPCRFKAGPAGEVGNSRAAERIVTFPPCASAVPGSATTTVTSTNTKATVAWPACRQDSGHLIPYPPTAGALTEPTRRPMPPWLADCHAMQGGDEQSHRATQATALTSASSQDCEQSLEPFRGKRK